MEREVLNVTAAAYDLDTTEDAIYKMVRARKIPFCRDGRKIFFLLEDLRAWCRQLRQVSVDDAVTPHIREDDGDDRRPGPLPLVESSPLTEGVKLVRGPTRPPFPAPRDDDDCSRPSRSLRPHSGAPCGASTSRGSADLAAVRRRKE
jgi:excisionase family DNA binding protein